jgi:hypothetical protein
LDYYNLFVFHGLGFDLLLFGTLQISLVFRFAAHALDRVHHVTLLRQEGVTEVGSPLDVVSQSLDHIGRSRQGLNTGIPVLLLHCIGESLVLQVLVLLHPLLKLNNFQRVGGCHERLTQKLIRIQRDRCYERIELIGRQLRRRLLLRSRGLVLSERKWRLHNQEQGANDGNQTSHQSDLE